MLAWMCGLTRLDKITNAHMRDSIRIIEIAKKTRENRLK